MSRYPDCESCAFQDEPAICDECDDADQWEPGEDLGFSPGQVTSTRTKVIRIHPKTPEYLLRKAA